MKQIYLCAALLIGSFCQAQYQQNFDTITTTTPDAGTSYNNLPQGWGIYEVGTGAAADGRYLVANGSNNTGTAYSFGTINSTDRSLGTIASNANFPTLGVIFFNEADTVVTNLTISYTGEQWRYGGRTGSPAIKDTLIFEYSLDATGIVNNVGTWIRVNALDFQSVYTTGSTAVVLDGNQAANRQTFSVTITGLNIQPGASIVLRWSDKNITGNDDGLGVDDFSISAGFTPGVMSSGGTNAGGGTGGGGGTADSTSTSIPLFTNKVQIDSSFLHLYGNLHAHTSHSDGEPDTGEPTDAFNYAKNVQGMDFLGISEHNHSTAGLQIANYKIGAAQANTANGQLNINGNPFIALHGMEWGTISSGGHVVIYGFGDSLIGWEPNNYDIYVAKADYIALFDKIRNKPGAFATLAHPNTTDFTALTGGYKGIADSAVSSVAIESGPAFSTTTTYNNFPASLAYINYYRSLLKRGYRVGANMDQDNHHKTYGSANQNRMVVLSADRTREGLTRGIQAMRIYATNDYNAKVNFSIDNYILGSSIVSSQPLTASVSYSDADGEQLSAVQVYGGKVGGSDATLIQTATNNTTFTIVPVANESWYYYAVLTQADGGKLVTSPIWVSSSSVLPVKLVEFKGAIYNTNQIQLDWSTSSEINTDYFVVERLNVQGQFVEIGRTSARDRAAAYSLLDKAPLQGQNYYRLKQVDKDGKAEYSKTVRIDFRNIYNITLSPNPSAGLVYVKNTTGLNQKLQVQVIDIAGNMVYNKQHSGTSFSLDLSSLPAGSYIVRVGEDIQRLVIAK